ncbi:MAG TPA: glycoside hydrolase family 3 N-terminal domain-containing protein [Gemmatimonadaceae bacterium]|nr:glycoside hydrolase family 3 N-terminal domain-containing protein [Gemmatimonadaceae bacterium]
MLIRKIVFGLFAAAAFLTRTAAAIDAQQTQTSPSPPYRAASLPVDARVRDLVSRMTPDEKFWQLFMIPGDLDNTAFDYSKGVFGLQIGMPRTDQPGGRQATGPTGAPLTDAQATAASGAAARAHAERINAIQKYFIEQTRLGIPIIPFDEAVHGLVRDGATIFPQAIGLAATWDTTLMGRVAGAIARETATRGIRQVLSPVVNLANDVRWGRVEETYGEDPVLTSLMARAFVGAFDRFGIVATPKHFVANVGDGGRDSYPIDLDERILDEDFFPPFQAAIAAGARSIMAAYNSVGGVPATQNRWLLTDKLAEWGFSGFVISDASGTGGSTVLQHTEASTATATQDAFAAGLDVVFQSSYPEYRPYLDAFRRGLVPDSVIDAAVSRVLRAKVQLGLFEHPFVDPDSAAYWNGNAAHRAMALEAARASIVLLKNEHSILPLSHAIKSLAVIGTDAVEARTGGYSAPAVRNVSILDGLRDRLGSAADVRYAPGPGRLSPDHVVIPATQLASVANGQTVRGLRGEYFDNNALAGAPRLVRTDNTVNFGWTLNSPGRGIPYDWYSVRWTGTVTVPVGGVSHLGIEGNDGYRLYVDGRLLIDDWEKRSAGTRLAPVTLAPGHTYDIKLEYFESTGNARVKLVWDAGVPNDWKARIDSAAALARRSDAAIVVGGIEEGEFRDRALLSLPGHQDELIRAVAATGTPVVVVLVGGSAITMSSWLDSVGGVLDVWYPGEEGGHAVADVLFGDYDPAGRLPITFPVFEGQVPLVYNHRPTGRGDDYVDLTGQPLFPFGFGLSYTTFDYANLAVEPASIGPTDSARVRCTVRNTGTRAGDEVVQLYIHDVLASTSRPVIQLEGFTRVHLAPGEARDVTFTLGPAQVHMLDRDMHWVVEPGAFRVMIGGSSKDIRLRGELDVH